MLSSHKKWIAYGVHTNSLQATSTIHDTIYEAAPALP